MSRKGVFVLVLWLIALVTTIVELAIGMKPQELVANYLALASPLIVYLTSRR